MSKTPKYIELPNEALYQEIEDIEWFSSVFNIEDKIPVPVESIEKVNSIFESIEFENQLYAMQADLSQFLCLNFRNEYQDWNSIVQHTKTRLVDCFEVINAKATKLGFNKAVIDTVKWDIVAYAQEQAYKSYKNPSYYSQAFSYYKIGRIPCGFIGVFPNGKFLVA